jgi:AbiU2
MPGNQQIEKLKGHALVLSEGCRDLIQSFALLTPMAENKELLKRFSRTKRALGFHTMRWSLMQECVIGIAKLAYDDFPQSPAAIKLARTVLAFPQQLRDRMKNAFAVPIRPVLASNRPETDQDRLVREEIERAETLELQQAFEDYLDELQKEVEWLEQNRESFKNLRDKRLAHLEVKFGDNGYELRPAKGPDWKTVKETISHLVRTAEIVLTILHKKDESFPQAIGIAQKTAADFWELGE